MVYRVFSYVTGAEPGQTELSAQAEEPTKKSAMDAARRFKADPAIVMVTVIRTRDEGPPDLIHTWNRK